MITRGGPAPGARTTPLLATNAYAVEPSKQVLLDKPVSGDDSKHGVTLMIDWPTGASVGDHTHPGDEYAVVLEGAVEVTGTRAGQPVAGRGYLEMTGYAGPPMGQFLQ